jgi:hypothetical protein
MIKATNKKEQQEFIKFLKKHNALIPFCVNLSLLRTICSSLFEWLNEAEPEHYIDSAFGWCNTKEGSMYWGALDYQWTKQVDQNRWPKES